VKALDKLGVRLLWNKKVKGGPMARWIPLIAVIYLVVLTALQAFGLNDAAESLKTLGGYIHIGDQSAIPADVLLPLLGTLFAGVGAGVKLYNLGRGALDKMADKAIPVVPLHVLDHLAVTRANTIAADVDHRPLGLLGAVHDGPGGSAPISNQDLGAAIAVIKANPNGFLQGLSIIAKVVLALFSRPARSAGAVVIACLLLGSLTGCAALVQLLEASGGPPTPPIPTPTPDPPPDPHRPVCDGPAGFVSACWHQPPEGWRYNCPDGKTVLDSSDCLTEPPPPPPPLPSGCAPLPGPATCRDRKHYPNLRGEHERAVNEAISTACALAGIVCDEQGPPRPGTWEGWVGAVADQLSARGYCTTYDYLHGESGRASEMSVRSPGTAIVENYQIEASNQRVRRPPGGFRSICIGGGEGQPIRPAVQPPPPPPPSGTSCPDTPDATKFVLQVAWNTREDVAWIDATPKTKANEWCWAHYGPDGPWPDPRSQSTCPLRPEGHPERTACDVAHGTPQWFVDGVKVSSDDNDPFHVHAAAGSLVKACLVGSETACSEAIRVTP